MRTGSNPHVLLASLIAGAAAGGGEAANPGPPPQPEGDGAPEGPVCRTLAIGRRYLHLPVVTGAPKRRMKLVLDGATVREFEIELALEEAEFEVFCEVGEFTGKEIELQVDRLPLDSTALDRIVQSDDIPGADTLYREDLRPQFHFSTRRGWNNDPNGLVYHDGEYHLYYQHNPYGWGWGNMHWGHAVSPDLLHWRELPVAIRPRRFGDWAYSGSAVVDRDDTSGFRTGAEEVIVAAFTSTDRGECIAFSNDRGRTFTDYAGNPVLAHQGRDPRIFWYEPGRHWVMAVYDETEETRGIVFCTSSDLKKWEVRSKIHEYYECPEIFELPVDGDSGARKWIVHGADGEYAIGSFDGAVFTRESGKHRFQYGNCFYASQTFNGIPAEDGRRIQVAWGTVSTPGMPFNQMMGFPVELSLRETPEGLRMHVHPLREIERLHGERRQWEDLVFHPGEDPLAGLSGDLWHLGGEFAVEAGARLELRVRGVPIVFDRAQGQLICLDRVAPLSPVDGRIRLEFLIDRTSVEVFANDGRIYMPMGVVRPGTATEPRLLVHGGEARIVGLTAWRLESIWR